MNADKVDQAETPVFSTRLEEAIGFSSSLAALGGIYRAKSISKKALQSILDQKNSDTKFRAAHPLFEGKMIVLREEEGQEPQLDITASQAMKSPGGIDLNSKNMVMNVAGEKIDIKFDPAMIAQFKAGDFTGVTGVIINITPLTSVLPLLGMKEPEENEKLAKV
jgi:hypothetical protein